MKKKLVMVTAYDYPTAKIIDEIGVDYILVGDSLGMVVLGYKDTKSVTLADIVYHTRAVARGAKNTMIVSDMPIHTYNTPDRAIKNARKLLKAGADVVKIEGYKPDIIHALTRERIKVMGHLGLLPQSAPLYKVQGKNPEEAKQIYEDAVAIDKTGIFALVLECIPASLAKEITNHIHIPTIGIGAGIHCAGQVLVLHDIIGLSDFQGKMVQQYADVKGEIKQAVTKFKEDVLTKQFPTKEHSFL